MYIPHFICASLDGPLGYFHILAVVQIASMLWTWVYKYVSESLLRVRKWNCWIVLNVLRNCPTVCHSAVPLYAMSLLSHCFVFWFSRCLLAGLYFFWRLQEVPSLSFPAPGSRLHFSRMAPTSMDGVPPASYLLLSSLFLVILSFPPYHSQERTHVNSVGVNYRINLG